jgi:hypothetical protein
MIRASTSWAKHFVPAGGVLEPQRLAGALKGIQQVTHPRGRDRQRPAASTPPSWPGDLQAQIGLALPGGQALPGRGLQQFKLHVVRAEPMCSISRDPRRDEWTICTAVAPDVVFTVRRYGDTGPAYGRRLVRNFSDHEQPTRRSESCNADQTQNVAEVRSRVLWPRL